MDYEKKYKDAIPYIKDLIEHNVISKESAGKYFPELKENEDERIREEIIATIHLYYGEPLEDGAKEMIAWLEKQGEQGKIIALRTEYEKGRADVLRCIDPDVMVADFCSQPLSKTRSLASIYRQGITDIIKRINNNEETSINSTHSIDDVGL